MKLLSPEQEEFGFYFFHWIFVENETDTFCGTIVSMGGRERVREREKEEKEEKERKRKEVVELCVQIFF